MQRVRTYHARAQFSDRLTHTYTYTSCRLPHRPTQSAVAPQSAVWAAMEVPRRDSESNAPQRLESVIRAMKRIAAQQPRSVCAVCHVYGGCTLVTRDCMHCVRDLVYNCPLRPRCALAVGSVRL